MAFKINTGRPVAVLKVRELNKAAMVLFPASKRRLVISPARASAAKPEENSKE